MPKTQTFRLAILIIAGESIFFLPFLLPRIFRPSMMRLFDLDNTDIGWLFSGYGIVAMISYALGGWLADRFSPKLLMSVALFLTAATGLGYFFSPSFLSIQLMYITWGATTILLFWSALIKATRTSGPEQQQGKLFGWLDGGRGAVAALVASSAAVLFSGYGFTAVLGLMIGSITLIATLILFLPEGERTPKQDKISRQKVITILSQSKLWWHSLLILCAYVGYKTTDDFPLLAVDAWDATEQQAAWVGSAAMWLRPIGAIFAGYLADRFGIFTLLKGSFILLLIGTIPLFGIENAPYSFFWVTISSTALAAYALRGLYFAVLEPLRWPISLSGTVVGFISFIGYLPDIFFGPLMGSILDSYPGQVMGHQYLFGILFAMGIIGFICVLFLEKKAVE